MGAWAVVHRNLSTLLYMLTSLHAEAEQLAIEPPIRNIALIGRRSK